MKTAVCVIVKKENEYIREFVEHYNKLGFDNVIIYDNNDELGEKLEDVILDYVLLNYVKIENFRGKTECQMKAYRDCYEKYSKDYDWIAFFDCDEFLEFKDKNLQINDFLSMSRFERCQSIHINWLYFDDNDQLDNDGRKIQERFTRIKEPRETFKDACSNQIMNRYVKTILRTKLKNVSWRNCPHTLIGNIEVLSPEGTSESNTSLSRKINHKFAYLKHYSYKSIGEYVRNKMQRLYPDQSLESAKKKLTFERFFKFNTYSKEKENYGRKYIE